MKKLIFGMLIVLIISTLAFAVNTISTSSNGVTITNVSADYTSPTEVIIWSIKFYPSATSDYATIRLNTAGGQIVTVLKNVSTLDPVIEYFPPSFRGKVMFDYGASSIATPANARIVVIYRR